MKDKLNFAMSFVGKKIVFDVSRLDYSIGTVKSVETTESNGYPKIKLVVEDILRYNSMHREGRTLNWLSIDRVLLTDYLNYRHQRWGMWAVADSKAGKDLVQRIERTWDRKSIKSIDKYLQNPYDPELLTEHNKKFYNMLVERKAAGLPIWVRTKYRADSTDYRLEKVEAKDYRIVVFRGKAFVEFSTIAYANRVKVTNFNKKYFFEEM